MGYSYQDIESRLRAVEDKLDFVMKTFSVTRQERSIIDPRQVLTTSMTLLDVYREVKSAGALVIPFEKKEEQAVAPVVAPTSSDEVVENGPDAVVNAG